MPVPALTPDRDRRVGFQASPAGDTHDVAAPRITTQNVEVGGVSLPPDSRITICIGATNRDPAQFPNPDRMSIAREPNRHVAFGFGIHTCAGLSLARLEARVAISRFLRGFRVTGSRVPEPAGVRRRLTAKGILLFSGRGKRCTLESMNLPVTPL
jgi:cytochrome P450